MHVKVEQGGPLAGFTCISVLEVPSNTLFHPDTHHVGGGGALYIV